MVSRAHRIGRAYLVCFLSFVAACWLFEAEFPQAVGYRLWLGPGAVAAVLALVVSISVWKTSRKLSLIGLLTLLLWLVWAALPRL
jgi:hypothetical protein